MVLMVLGHRILRQERFFGQEVSFFDVWMHHNVMHMPSIDSFRAHLLSHGRRGTRDGRGEAVSDSNGIDSD